LLAPYEEGKAVSPEMERMALARLRQLSAHEVGHTLGLAHNYIASVANRSSVMDYPHPLAKLRPDRTIDLGDAYASGIGEWDKVSIAAGYAQFAPGTNEAAAVDGILRAARERGLFISRIRMRGRRVGRIRWLISGTAARTRSTSSTACSTCVPRHSRASVKT
jgi:hypothetical protein